MNKAYRAKSINLWGSILLLTFAALGMLFFFSVFSQKLWIVGFESSTIFFACFFFSAFVLAVFAVRSSFFLLSKYEFNDEFIIIKEGSEIHKLKASEVRNLRITDRVQFGDSSGKKYLVSPDFEDCEDFVSKIKQFANIC